MKTSFLHVLLVSLAGPWAGLQAQTPKPTAVKPTPGEVQRSWVDQQGRAVKARLLDLQGPNVILELENGTTSLVPLAKFSSPDQTYVVDWAKQHAKADPLVAARPLVWPPSVEVNVADLQIKPGVQDKSARNYVYLSGSFQFTSNAPLTGTLMRDIARDFELVNTLFKSLPWGWQPRPSDGNDHFMAALYETEKDYIAAGGDDSSSGWSKDNLIFTKFSTLGLKKVGERYMRDPAKVDHQKEMIGLITRLVMADMRKLASPWAAYGIEHFLEEAAYHNGTFQFTKAKAGMKALIDKRAQFNTRADADSMLKLLKMPWSEDRGHDIVEIRRQNYLNGALLVYYFGFLDGDGKGTRLHRYYQKMAQDSMAWRRYEEARKAGDRTVVNPRPNTAFSDWAMSFNEIVVEGRSDAKLKEEIVAKFKSVGIKM